MFSFLPNLLSFLLEPLPISMIPRYLGNTLLRNYTRVIEFGMKSTLNIKSSPAYDKTFYSPCFLFLPNLLSFLLEPLPIFSFLGEWGDNKCEWLINKKLEGVNIRLRLFFDQSRINWEKSARRTSFRFSYTDISASDTARLIIEIINYF